MGSFSIRSRSWIIHWSGSWVECTIVFASQTTKLRQKKNLNAILIVCLKIYYFVYLMTQEAKTFYLFLPVSYLWTSVNLNVSFCLSMGACGSPWEPVHTGCKVHKRMHKSWALRATDHCIEIWQNKACFYLQS